MNQRADTATDSLIYHYQRRWNLVPDGDIVETHTSWGRPVLADDVRLFLKVCKAGSDEQHAAAMLRYFGGDGAVRLVRAEKSALLMERASGGECLMAMAISGGDDQAAAVLAATTAELHRPRTGTIPAGLPSLRNWFASLFEAEAGSDLLGRCASVTRRLLDTERDIIALHGDLHHDNVLDGEARGWLAIDPKGIVGERAYDVANLLGNPWDQGEIVHDAGRMRRLAELYASRLDLDVSRVLGFALAHAGLSAAWSIGDERDPAFRLRCAEILDPLVE